jgi:hypothetical protein
VSERHPQRMPHYLCEADACREAFCSRQGSDRILLMQENFILTNCVQHIRGGSAMVTEKCLQNYVSRCCGAVCKYLRDVEIIRKVKSFCLPVMVTAYCHSNSYRSMQFRRCERRLVYNFDARRVWVTAETTN